MNRKLVTALSLLGFATPAFAYLDPSTGSMILSAVVGLFATAGLAIKTYWYKLKRLFRRGEDAGAPRETPAGARDGQQAGSD